MPSDVHIGNLKSINTECSMWKEITCTQKYLFPLQMPLSRVTNKHYIFPIFVELSSWIFYFITMIKITMTVPYLQFEHVTSKKS